jgi:hypothetical protein
MKINAEEQKGEQSLKGLISLTKPKEKKKDSIIKELEDLGVFN